MRVNMTGQSDTTLPPETKAPLMDLRTNAIDLGLDPRRPGSCDRAKALAEALLAYCDRHAIKEDGECLAEVDLLSWEELEHGVTVETDPDSPQTALAEQDALESTEDDPARVPNGETGGLFAIEPLAVAVADATAKLRKMTVKALNRKAIERFTRLMAESHGYGSTRARSKRFAGVVDAGAWKKRGGGHGAKAKALVILGGQRPGSAVLGGLWEHAWQLDTLDERRRWIEKSPISNWGRRSGDGGNGPHISASIALSHLLDLALRVFIRERGFEEDVADDEVGLLLGNLLLMKAGMEHKASEHAGFLKGYEVSLSFDKQARLLVGCRKRVQRLERKFADQLGSVSPGHPDWPELQCQALAPLNKMDAVRFGNKMDFFVAAYLGSDSTRNKRIDKWIKRKGLDEAGAREKERENSQRILSSGIVLANHAQDLVEQCLEEALGAEGWTPIRFRPTEKRQVMVEARGKHSHAQFLLSPLPVLQVLYDEELRVDHRLEKIHAGLIEALYANGMFGQKPGQEGWRPERKEGHVIRLASLDAADPLLPVLVVQTASRIRTARGAAVMQSAWFKAGDKEAVSLSGNVTAKALELRGREEEAKREWSADAYTLAKLSLYDTTYSKWQALQGLNLEAWELEHLMRGKHLDLEQRKSSEAKKVKDDLAKGEKDRIDGFLYKLLNTFQEIKYKHLLSHQLPFDLGTAWRHQGGADQLCEGQRFVCLYGQSPKGAPARVGVLEYYLEAGVLHLGEVATAAYRMPKEDRETESKQAVVRRKQLREAYGQALSLCKGEWAPRLSLFIDDLVRQDEGLNEVLMVFSPAEGHLLRESEEVYGGWSLLGATWKGFPFESILRDGPKGFDGKVLPHLGRKAQGAMARQLMPVADADVVLEPDGGKVRGIRVMRGVDRTSKHNNPLIIWEVLVRESGTGRIASIDNPEGTRVFSSFVETLTDDLIRKGRVSRTPLPGKLVKTLVKN